MKSLSDFLPYILALVGIAGFSWSITLYFLNKPTVKHNLAILTDQGLIEKVSFWQEQAKLVEPLQRLVDEQIVKLTEKTLEITQLVTEIGLLNKRIDKLESGAVAAAAAVTAAAKAAAAAVTAAAAVAAQAVTTAASQAVIAADIAAAEAASAAVKAAAVTAAATTVAAAAAAARI